LPLIRKIITVGKYSRAIVIPPSWIKDQEEQVGHPIDEILMEVDGSLTITPRKQTKA